MRERRVVLFAVAAVLVVLAVGLVFWYVSSADDRAARDVETIDALVAISPIPAGTTGRAAIDNGWVGFEPRERGTIPSNTIRDANDLDGLIAATSISERQFVTSDTFVTPQRASEGGPLVSQIAQEGDDDPSARQAVAIALDSEKTVDGNVQPGDVVNVIAIGRVADGEGRGAGFLLTEVPVIGRPGGDGDGGGSVILALEPDEVLKLVAAKDAGYVLWLTLVPRDYETPTPAPIHLPSPAPVEGMATVDLF